MRKLVPCSRVFPDEIKEHGRRAEAGYTPQNSRNIKTKIGAHLTACLKYSAGHTLLILTRHAGHE